MRLPPIAFIAILCLSHVLTMLGFSLFSVLLPEFLILWSMSATEGGLVNSAMFAGYTLAVPILVSLTDRIDARKIYIAATAIGAVAHIGFAFAAQDVYSAALFRAIYGASLAGTYMPGLRVLGEHLPAPMVTRATGYYTASFSLGAAVSYVLSAQIANSFGSQTAFFAAAIGATTAAIVIFAVARPCSVVTQTAGWLSTFDPRRVFKNRSAMAFSICYALHSYELFTVRSWLVAFLAAMTVTGAPSQLWAPAIIAAFMTFAGVFASLAGNELAIRAGRRRSITFSLVISGLVAIGVAGASTVSYTICVILVIIHGITIMLDSAALTAGAFGSANPDERGITMAVHSTLGFGGAIIGPLVFGAIVDGFGSPSQTGWAVAYAHMALIVFAGPLVLKWLKPEPLTSDRRG